MSRATCELLEIGSVRARIRLDFSRAELSRARAKNYSVCEARKPKQASIYIKLN